MAHLLKYSEWQNSIGKWYSGDVSNLAHGSNYWWHAPRMLQIPLTDFILLLKDKYKANVTSYCFESNVLIFNWDNYNDCHKFTLFINNEARKRKFFI